MNTHTHTKNINKVINLIAVIISFLLPIFFLTTTTEFFELNKLALLITGTIVLLVTWGIKFLASSQVNTIKSKLNLPLLVLVGIYILATIFSLNPATSMFGTYARWFPSLYAIGTLIAFYYVIAANIKEVAEVNKIVYAVLAGITLSSIVALLNYFGFYIGSAPFMQSPNFTLTGSTTTTAVVASLAFVIATINLVNSKFTPEKILLTQIAIVNIAVVGLYNMFPAWVVIVVGIIASLYFVEKKKFTNKQNIGLLAIATGVAVALILVVNLPQTKELIVNKDFGREIVLSLPASWKVASATIGDYPLIGSGPATFALNYTRYKPLSLNTTDFWNVNFDKPTNELFNTMTDIGIVGTIIAIYLGVKVLSMATSTKEHPAISTAVIAMLALFLVSYATVLTATLFVIFLALLTSQTGEHIILKLSSLGQMSLISDLTEKKGDKKSSNGEILQYLAIIPLIIFSGLWGFYFYKTYGAEVYMRKATVAAQENNGTLTYQYMQKAITLNGQRAEYRNVFARTNLAIANSLSQKEDITETDKTNIQSLVSQSINQARVATEVLNPLSSRNWEERASIYRTLVGVAQNANEWSIGAYQNAIQLDPNNPRLRLELGGLYFAQEDYLTAANLFRQATNLKADYANAHYNLAQALIKLENYDLARREIEVVMQIVPQDSNDYTLLKEELSKLPTQQQASQPTIEQLNQQAQIQEQGQATQQEPLTKAGTSSSIEEKGQFDLTKNASDASKEVNQ